MPGARRARIAVEAERRWLERRARIGRDVQEMRRRRGWSQSDLAARAGIGRGVVARLEQADGRLDLELVERVGIALGVSLSVSFGRDPREEVADAGHLAIQELVLRLGRESGFDRQFELPTRPAEPWRSIDVALGSSKLNVAIEVECWNTIGDVGAAARSSARKLAELEQAALARWGEDARAALVWVVRHSARNRALIARYPEVFAVRFPGSSRAWVAALAERGQIPKEPGLVWCDARRGRLFAWRRREHGRGSV